MTQPNFITMTEISCKYPHEKVQNVLTLVLTIQNLANHNGLVTFRGPHKRDQTKTIMLIKPLNTSQDDAADHPKSATPNQQGDKSLQSLGFAFAHVDNVKTLSSSSRSPERERERKLVGRRRVVNKFLVPVRWYTTGRPGRRTPMST